MRDQVLQKVRPQIADLLADIETKTGLTVGFLPIPVAEHVSASYTFDPSAQTATVQLGDAWEDVDVAHELTHMKLELVDGHPVLARQQGASPEPRTWLAVNLIRSYVDDELVHAELVERGFRLDGEIIRPQFFDDVCTNVPRNLRGRGKFDQRYDGMTHLDQQGYGVLRRSTFFVLAALLKKNYADALSPKRLSQINDLLAAFRKFSKNATWRANDVLHLFSTNDIKTVAGHSAILKGWLGLEQLTSAFGPATYARLGGQYQLQFLP